MQADHIKNIHACFAAVSYIFPWVDCINNFKFHDAIGYSDMLARIMLNQSALAHAFMHANIVIPMPLHTSRLAERGYNQSLLLARSMCKRIHSLTAVRNNPCMLKNNALKRTRATQVQNQLPMQQRQRNVHGAFAVPQNMRQFVANQHVALVDDVLTTGASANAAASALKKAGAKTVTVFVFARAEK